MEKKVFIINTNILSFFVLFLIFTSACSPKATSTRNAQNLSSGKDGKGAYSTKHYRNLFQENGHTEQEINARITDAFQQLFHGDSATQKIYFPAGSNDNGPKAYILDVNNNDIRSEGMSYGMMISVQLDKKAEFDAIWNYAATHMYINNAAHPCEGYFSWSLKRDGTPNSETPAPDGEEYFTMSLYFASARWGNGTGIYDYKAWADKILTTMRHHPEKTGSTFTTSRNRWTNGKRRAENDFICP